MDIQGFATDISVNRGETVRFKVDTGAASYRIDIYRLGYYGGDGARQVATVLPTAALPQDQPDCLVDAATGLVDCGNWGESASWAVPADAVSGIYLGRLVRTDGPESASHMVFIVRDDAGGSDLLFQTSDTTWQAYNRYGGNSLYTGSPAGRAYKVSYNRPFTTRQYAPEDWLFNAEYPMVRWLERNGYNVSYTAGIDTDRRGAELLEHDVFLSVGHDEYWSGDQRANVEAARDAGVHLAFFSGNESFWKTRYEPSIDGSATAHRTLVCYKETHANAKIDPLGGVWTGTWRDARFSPPADGGRPENGLTGTLFMVNEGTTAITVPEAQGKTRFWRNTSVATLPLGGTATLSAGTLGYEWDVIEDNGAQPAGLMRLSTTTAAVPQKLLDLGNTYGPGSATHSLAMYRAASGALVFGAGTVQWSWGLDAVHDRSGAVTDTRMQQATVNLFADMGVTPMTLQSGLVVTMPGTDTVAPLTIITAPTSGSSVLMGTSTTISGTASDTGGVVAGVEVSVDGGTTWQSATGTNAWSYSWTPTAAGPASLVARGVDDSGNLAVSAGVNVTVVTTLPPSCPCSLWTDAAIPPITDAGADSAVQLGVKFRSNVDGFISGIRFYKSVANGGPHVGTLWSTSGTLLASVTFNAESASGWQTAVFDEPVPVSANTVYIAAYHAPTGHYSYAGGFFSTDLNSGPLTAPRSSETPNGVFRYGTSTAFPNQTFNAANYWVDVVFDTSPTDETAPTVTSVVPAAGTTGIDINSSVTATFSEPMDPSTVTSSTVELRDAANALVPASVSYNAATRTAILDPTPSLNPSETYTATLRGGTLGPVLQDQAANPLAAPFVWSFTIAGDTTPPTVVGITPAGSATGVPLTASLTATFSEDMAPGTITGTTFELRNSANALVPAALSYNEATRIATLTPTAPLTALTTYTATLRGGATDPRVKDAAGNALGSNFAWSFTTAAPPPSGCPCTVFTPSAVPANADSNDTGSVELGMKFFSDTDGYILGVRFYKSAANIGTHVGNLWTVDGTLLSSVIFTGETASGWQQASFATPVAVTANTTYVVSYFAPAGRYSYSSAGFAAAVNNAPLHAPANGTTPNGLYRYGGSSGFPTQSFNATNYWVDAVFSLTTGGPDTTAPVVMAVQPAVGEGGVNPLANITVTFSEPINPATITSSTFVVRDASNVQVNGALAYNEATRSATLDPVLALAYSSAYTVTLEGGLADPRIKDAAGNALSSDFVWSFTTGNAPLPSPNEGPGGPVLVITDPSNPFGRYFAEILRTEGLNHFAVADIANVNAGVLASYDLAVLANIALTPAQVAMLTNWVNGGGNLIAMRPDKQLAGLLGLLDAGGTLSNAYLLVQNTGAGTGIVNQTMQFHGTADLYALNGATLQATLYSTAATPLGNPAVSVRDLGPSGGQVAAFTYDLARSVVYTRQGNPAWAGQERDGSNPVRVNDLFFGAAPFDPQPDWVDLDKVAIPQADEQMRLLRNLIVRMNLRKKPLPAFWYFPKGKKAVVIMTGDDHANGGTAGRFEQYKNLSPAGCNVNDWECVRGTSYLYVNSPLTPAQALAHNADGFEVALHYTTFCQNLSPANAATELQNQLGAFRTKYAGLPSPATNRTHCLAWNGYGSPAQMELANGIRLDTSYYYWPAAWVADRPGMHTGSGMPMRFAQSTGAIVDVYQAPTQMNDEAGQTYPATAVTLLDRALGAEGYYGAFTANMHTDTVSSPGSDAIVTAALARGVPIVAAQQMLTWLDGRNASSFGSLNWQTGLTGNPLGGSVLSFTIHVGAGANGLTATVPSQASTGKLTAITRDTTPVAFTVQTIKGVEYAVFPAVAGLYAVTYDSTAPETTITSNPPLLTNQTNGTFSFTATEAGATFECSIDAQPFAPCTSAAMVGGLGQGPHTFRVRGTDTAGNVDPTPASYTWTVDLTGPAVTTRTPAPGAAGVAFGTTVVAQFAEPLNASSVTTATFRLRASGSGTDVPAAVTYSGTTATLTPSATLALGTTYHVTLDASLVDLAGNTMGSDVTWSFTTINTVTDTLVADFGAGTADANVYLASAADGELMLTPAIGTEFTGGALPAGWAATAWNPGGAAVMGGGRVTVDGARLHPAGLVGAGRSLEFGATFSGAPFEHVGFGVTMNETPWAIFSTSGGGALWARTHNGASAINTPIPGAWLNVPHQYRIEWNATSVVFYIDGVQVASHATTIAAQMRPIITNYATGGGVIAVDYLRMSDYATPGTFTSRVFDARGVVNWTNAAWSAAVPAGTGVTVSVRFGATPTPDGTWTPFTAVGAGGAIGGNSRYVQYRIEMSTTSPAQTPSVGSITLTASTP